LLLPNDDLNLAVVLKGPLIGLSEESLLALAAGRPGRLWSRLTAFAALNPMYVAAANWLNQLLSCAYTITPYELCEVILSMPCPAGLGDGRCALLKQFGSEAEDAIDNLLESALTFESQQPASLQLFLQWLRVGELKDVKHEVDTTAEGQSVRIITIHSAKGLQAPVIFLPDTTVVPTHNSTMLWPEEKANPVPLWIPHRDLTDSRLRKAQEYADHQRSQEYHRLLYVALTRAQDRLYICGWHGKSGRDARCWYDLCKLGLNKLSKVHPYSFLPLEGDSWSGEVLRYQVPQLTIATPSLLGAESTSDQLLPEWARLLPSRAN
jgi:ATP-dependent helicase/nuclease subunit A